MKRALSSIIALAALIILSAAPTQKQNDYIARWSGTARSEMMRTGVPASITLAQGMLESGNGESLLSREANNHFGVKAGSTYHGPVYKTKTKEFSKGKMVTVEAAFRKYGNAEQSFADHSDFLRYSTRYRRLFELDPTDYAGWAKGLSKAGYATDPEYADKLIRLIEDCDLARFDTKNAEPETPETPQEALDTPSTPMSLEQEVEVEHFKGSERYSYKINRKVYKVNSTAFVKAHKGETYTSIAKLFDLFHGEILMFNDVKNDHELAEGERVFIQAKKNKSVKGLEKHVISEKCESLWSIGQEYGVKLKKIHSLNKLGSDYVPVEGDVIVLRKTR